MPDFEIRYFHADGSLAIVHITVQANQVDAEDRARSNLDDYAHFEVRQIGALPHP